MVRDVGQDSEICRSGKGFSSFISCDFVDRLYPENTIHEPPRKNTKNVGLSSVVSGPEIDFSAGRFEIGLLS